MEISTIGLFFYAIRVDWGGGDASAVHLVRYLKSLRADALEMQVNYRRGILLICPLLLNRTAVPRTFSCIGSGWQTWY